MEYEQMKQHFSDSILGFANEFGFVKNEKGEKVPMNVFDTKGSFFYTSHVLDSMRTSEKVIIGKTRLHGGTTDLITYASWYALMHPGSEVCMFFSSVPSAKNAFDKLEFFLKSSSDFIEYDLNHYTEDAPFYQIFSSPRHIQLFNGSHIKLMTNTKSEIHKERAEQSLVLFDEIYLFNKNDRHDIRILADAFSRVVFLGAVPDTYEDHWFEDFTEEMKKRGTYLVMYL